MDREFAIRLVLFEYLLPLQNASRRSSFCVSLLRSGITTSYENVGLDSLMHILQHIADRLMITQGYPTSYTCPQSYRRCYIYPTPSRTVDAMTLASANFNDAFVFPRNADPPTGIPIFKRI